ncbi:MAG: TatD family hydrolase [Candidatus Omnitrophota bacterium]
MPQLIDTHAHLEEIPDLSQALEQAKAGDVETIVGVSQDLPSCQALLKLCQDYKDIIRIVPACGVHPGRVEKTDLKQSLEFIENNIQAIAAVGEIGLDYWYPQARKPGLGRDQQLAVFAAQLDLASRYHKPVVVHSRGAWLACLELLKQKQIIKANFHWFSGPEEILDEILKSGYLISATPAAEYSKEHRRAIEKAPLESILLETDAPVRYKPASGEYNAEPKDVQRTLAAVAKIKNVSPDFAAQVTKENARKFFGL